MTRALQPPVDPGEQDPCAQIALALAERGWCVTPGFVQPELMEQLAREARERWQAGRFRHAGVGRGARLEIRPEIRNDWVQWLDPSALTAAQQSYFRQLERLRLALNSRLFLGLFDFEGHLAVYPTGSFYRRHADQFRDIGLRAVTTILYLNKDWTDSDGGQLRIYTDPEAHQDVLPTGGCQVTFFSAEFEHEVLVSRRDRLSLTGWFRVRANA